jgi:hypothetical protein
MRLFPVVVLAGIPAVGLLYFVGRDDAPAPATAPAPSAVTAPAPRAAVAQPVARPAVTPAPRPRADDRPAAESPPTDPDDPRWARNDPHLDFFTSELRDSGDAAGAWTALPDQVLDTWRATLAPEVAARVDFAPFECFARGCITVATYDDEASYLQLNDALPETEAFRLFPGWRHRSAPTRDPSGRVSVTWVFMSPSQT